MNSITHPAPALRAAGGHDEPTPSPDTAGAIPLRAPPWVIPAFGALIALLTGVLWETVL